MFSDDIVTSGVAQLIQLALTLKTSLEFFVCSPARRQFSVFDRERVLSTIPNLNEYKR